MFECMKQLFFDYKYSFQGVITYITGRSAVSFFEYMEVAAKWVAPVITLLTVFILLLTAMKMVDEWVRKEFDQSLFGLVFRKKKGK